MPFAFCSRATHSGCPHLIGFYNREKFIYIFVFYKSDVKMKQICNSACILPEHFHVEGGTAQRGSEDRPAAEALFCSRVRNCTATITIVNI